MPAVRIVVTPKARYSRGALKGSACENWSLTTKNRCSCSSTSPGKAVCPARSSSCAPRGIWTRELSPTALIFAPSMTMVWFVSASAASTVDDADIAKNHRAARLLRLE